MKLVFKSREDDRNDVLKITRGSNDYDGDIDGYRTRTFELNGKKIFEGQEGDASYLIPWIWDTEGNVMDTAEQKLYHWNTNGGTTEWELPEGWEDVSSVYVYELTDLEPNTKYVAYVGVDNRSDTEVTMEIDNGETVTSNSAPKSIARNFVQAYAHNTLASTSTVGNTSYFQHMYVYFETGADADNVTLTIKRAPGEGTSCLDDIRIVANESDNYPSEGFFVQDFETVPQGIWPFVVGNREGVTDNRTHLSELHVPYTQRGWNGKAVNDVIQGTWSVKTNGLAGGKGLIYQTIPQNFKFEPGVDYVVSFDYESGSDDTYALVTGSKPYENGGPDTQMNLKNTIDLTGPGNCTFTLTGADNGQSWFGIVSTGTQADTRGVTNGNQINFNGYKDFMLDNLVISAASGQKGVLRTLIAQAQLLSEENFDAASWEAFKFALDTARTVNDDVNATQQRVDEAVKALEKAMGVLVQTGNTITGTVKDTDENLVLDFVLTPAFTSITGKMTAAGAPAGQANVTIRAAGGEQMVQTDAVDYVSNWTNGTTFKNLPGNSTNAAISTEQGKTKLQFSGSSHTNVYDSAAPAFKNGCVEMDIQVPQSTTRTSLTMKAEIIDRTVKLWLKPSGAPESDYKLVLNVTMNTGMQKEPGYVGINSSRGSRALTVNSLKVTSYDLLTGTTATARRG